MDWNKTLFSSVMLYLFCSSVSVPITTSVIRWKNVKAAYLGDTILGCMYFITLPKSCLCIHALAIMFFDCQPLLFSLNINTVFCFRTGKME